MRSSTFTIAVLLATVPTVLNGTTYHGPSWPQEAIDEGIEGWVEMEYWVNAECDLKVQVTGSEPPGLFESTAKEAVRRLLQSEHENVDWDQIDGVERPDDRIISLEEYEALEGKVERAGPWPVSRTIRRRDGKAQVECLFGPDGSIRSIERSGSEEYTGSLRAIDSAGDSPLLVRDTIRVDFEIYDE